MKKDADARSWHPAKSVKAARNLPITMPKSEMGAVRSSCSVRVLRSSLKDFMVRSGIRRTYRKTM